MVGAMLVIVEAMAIETNRIVVFTVILFAVVVLVTVMVLPAVILIAMQHRTHRGGIAAHDPIAHGRTGS